MEIIVIIAVFWVVGKILKGIFGGFSKSDYRRDPKQAGIEKWVGGPRESAGKRMFFAKFREGPVVIRGPVPFGCKFSARQSWKIK